MENNGNIPDGVPLFTYDMHPHAYVQERICEDIATAKRIHKMLRGQAENIAKRDGIPIESAFVRTFESHRDSRVMTEFRMAFNAENLLGRLYWGFTYPEENEAMLRWIQERFKSVWAGKEPAGQAALFERCLFGIVRVIYGHMSCGFVMKTTAEYVPMRDITDALDLWAEVNWRVPFCHYRRLLQAAEVRNLPRAKIATLLRTHGTARLGDIIQLLIDDALSPALLDEFLAEPALFAALSYDDVRAIIPTRTDEPFRDVARTLANILPSLSKAPAKKDDPPIRRGLVMALDGLLPGWRSSATVTTKREDVALKVSAFDHVLDANAFVPIDRAILQGKKADAEPQAILDERSTATEQKVALVKRVTAGLSDVCPHIERNLAHAHRDLGIEIDVAGIDEKIVLFAQMVTVHLPCLESNPAVLNSMRTGDVCFGTFVLFSWWGGEVAPCVCMELSHLLAIRGIAPQARLDLLPRLFQPERAADLLGLARRAEFDAEEVGVMIRSSEVMERNDFASLVRMLAEWRHDNRKHSLYRYDRSPLRSASP